MTPPANEHKAIDERREFATTVSDEPVSVA